MGVKVPASSVNQKQKIIRLVLGLGIAYLLFDTFMATDEPVVEEPAVVRPRKPRRNRGVTPTETPAPTPGSPSTEAPGAVAPDAPVVAAPETPAPETTPAPTEAPASDIFAGEDLAPIEATAPTEPAAPEDVVTENPTPEPTETQPSPEAAPVDNGEESGGESASKDQVTDTVAGGTTEDMTDKILKDLEDKVLSEQTKTAPGAGPYVSPPSYDFPGRGLVYNCIGKHWACVDGGSYQACQNNFRSLFAQSLKKECYADSVYETQQGCEWVQKQKVSNSTKTDFCN